ATFMSRLAPLLFLALPLWLGGCATVLHEQALVTEEFMVPSADPGIELYVRNKRPASESRFPGERIVLFVHGSTYPAETAFDLPLSGVSWMGYIARQAYEAYLLDLPRHRRAARRLSGRAGGRGESALAHRGAGDEESRADSSRLVRSLGGGDFQLGPLGRETGPEKTARAERHPAGHARILERRQGVLRAGDDPRADPAPGRRMGPGHAALHGAGPVSEARQRALQAAGADRRGDAYRAHGKEPHAAVPRGAGVPRSAGAAALAHGERAVARSLGGHPDVSHPGLEVPARSRAALRDRREDPGDA